MSEMMVKKTIIGDATCAIPDGKAFLVEKFSLDNFYAKFKVIRENSQNSYDESIKLASSWWQKMITATQENTTFGLDVADLGVASVFNAITYSAKKAYKIMPSFLVSVLVLGTMQMILRASNDQKSANTMRDNIGALTEATAFFVLVNGFLDNLFHSTALIAPSCVGIAAYDKLARPVGIAAYDKLVLPAYAMLRGVQSSEKATIETNTDEEAGDVAEIEDGPVANGTDVFGGSFTNVDAGKLIESLEGIREFFDEDAMWTGLRNSQLAYAENHLETTLRADIGRLINALEEFSGPTTSQNITKNINLLLQTEFKQTLKDMSVMMQAYVEVCEKKNPGSGIKECFQKFCNSFARDGILLSDASPEAEWAVFCMRHEAGLIGWDDRIKASLPDLPSARELLLAGVVIGAFFMIIEIYKAATGKEKEPISSWLLDLPTHVFELLGLNQLYDNLGGGAAATEWFKQFFAGFNLTENSSHFYIAAIPIINYLRKSSKMFEGLHHAPINGLAYLDQKITSGAIRKKVMGNPSSVSTSTNNLSDTDIVSSGRNAALVAALV